MAATTEVEATASSGPRVSTVRLSSLIAPTLRLDAKYFQDEFTLAQARLAGSGLPLRLVGDVATAFVPGRAKLITTISPNAGAPYLKAHDAFMTRPESDRYVVASRTRDYEDYLLRPGMILTPSSGRNLGPTVYVGDSLRRFAMTDIMRVMPRDEDEGLYLLAYLRTPTGQAMVRRGRTGNVVDHLAPSDVLTIPVPYITETERGLVVRLARDAEESLDSARRSLEDLEQHLHALAGLPLPPATGPHIQHGGHARAFETARSDLTLRLDAEYYNPDTRYHRELVRASGHSATLAAVAELRLLGRYKRYYVDREHGRPILSGTQLLQLFPVNLKYISDRSFTDPDRFVLRRGWTVFTCDGRAEEGLASPAFVHSLWDGWMASNHVMRAIPRDGVPPGYLYLAMRSPYVQSQLKARATGSVIDALDPTTVGDVLLPMVSEQAATQMGEAAVQAWEDIAEATRITERYVTMVESQIVHAYER